ncbi:MAG: hypothetical protein IJ007_06220 [Oscillospiraceae bacterium]|nr:hypothetical protein [Oscillospiraceae bacterium]
MITNASCTIYNQLGDGTFKRTYLPAVFWRDVKAEQIKKYGAENASEVDVMIFSDQLHDYVKAESFNGDGWTSDTRNDTYIVKGNCVDEISDDVTMLYENNREVYKVCAAIENLYGSSELWHVRIEGR